MMKNSNQIYNFYKSNLQTSNSSKAENLNDTLQLANHSDIEENLPDDCFCPITHEIMNNPVVATDGHSYEKSAIENWFSQGNKLSPKTGVNLESTLLIPNLTLRNLITSLKEKAQESIELEKQVTKLNLAPSNDNQSTNNASNVNTSSSFFSTQSTLPYTQAVDINLQNLLVEKIFCSQLESVQALLTQGALLSEPDKDGIYPLVAAAYSCNLDTIKYVEKELGAEVGLYWSKINLDHFNQYIQDQMPEKRPTGICRASYEWLANWYSANANKAWNAQYDKFVLDNWFRSGVKGWNEENWQARSARIRSSAGSSVNEVWSGYEWSSYKIYRPPVNTHDNAVYAILSELIQCKNYVEVKIEEQQFDVRFEY